MTRISISSITYSEAWKKKAGRAQRAIEAATTKEEREAVFKRYRTVWADLSNQLGRCSNKKCWYCESQELRSDMPVDHYRPKSEVQDCPTHPGYWWMAFRPDNFRYSCTYCNSWRIDDETGIGGGKQTSFPLDDEARRCAMPGEDLTSEEPLLLDPVKEGDSDLLFFEDDGRAVPAFDISLGRLQYRKAAKSIEVFHLNHSDTKKARKRIYRRIYRIVQHGDSRFDGVAPSEEDAEAFGVILEEVEDVASDEAPFTAAARMYLRRFYDPDERPWLSMVFEGLNL